MKAYFANIAHAAGIFGWWHRETLLACFPPFYGAGIGCEYCELFRAAKKERRCERGKAHGFLGCGLSRPNYWEG
jgi:hypothetical protein